MNILKLLKLVLTLSEAAGPIRDALRDDKEEPEEDQPTIGPRVPAQPTRPEPPTLDRAPGKSQPTFKVGYVDPLVWQAAYEEAPKRGVRPETLVAIQVWESNWFTSKLFGVAHNVGGVKYRPDLPSLGHRWGSYEAKDGNVYASWPNWRAGVAGHAQFLAQRRYDAVRRTEDVREEVRAIHDAGYAEHSQDWLQGVTNLAVKFEGERAE